MHVALRIAYDGTLFDGYARQPGRRTVEGCLLAAAEPEGGHTLRTGSRTDRGVSALENVVRLTLDRPHRKGLVPALQRHLPPGLWVTAAAEVDADWNPRHAVRTYRYTALRHGEDLERLREACEVFMGRHDMTAFARIEGRNPEREILAFTVKPDGLYWTFHVTSPGFLWNQVRRMVDAVLRVGRGEAVVEDILESLRSGRPHGSFKIAHPEGLLLERVAYDPEPTWAEEAGRPSLGAIEATVLAARTRDALGEHLVRLSRMGFRHGPSLNPSRL